MSYTKYHENYYDDPKDYPQLMREDDRGRFCLINPKTPLRKILERLALWERKYISMNEAYFWSKEEDWMLKCTDCENCDMKDACDMYDSENVSEEDDDCISNSTSDVSSFIKYINEKWLVPLGAEKNVCQSRWLYKPEDKREIVKMALRCNICDVPPSRLTFQRVVRYMREKLGYSIESNKGYIEGRQVRYTLIVQFDESGCDIFQNSTQANKNSGS